MAGAVDTDDQGSIIAREYDVRHVREHRTPEDVLDAEHGPRPRGKPHRRPTPPEH